MRVERHNKEQRNIFYKQQLSENKSPRFNHGTVRKCFLFIPYPNPNTFQLEDSLSFTNDKFLKMERMFPVKHSPLVNNEHEKGQGRIPSLKTEKEVHVTLNKWITATTLWCFLFLGMLILFCFVLFKVSARRAQEVFTNLQTNKKK